MYELINRDKDPNQILLLHANKVHQIKDYANSQVDTNWYRGTNLIGISKNGRCNWQILSMIEGKKSYLGTVDNILKAAIIYDIFVIQSKGIKA